MNEVVNVRCGELLSERGSGKYLKIILSGKGDAVEISAKDGTYNFSRGEIAVIPPLLSYTVTGGGAGTIAVFLDHPMLPLKNIAVIQDVESAGIRFAAEQALRLFDGQNTRIVNALGELIVSFAAKKIGQSEKSPVVATLREDIERGAVDATYSVEAFMRKLPLNYDYVRKLFKKETGLTPHEYLTAVRMERAKKIILSGVSNRYSAYTIGQIAEACGYAEPLYFSRVFKKYFGISPTDYAKMNK